MSLSNRALSTYALTLGVAALIAMGSGDAHAKKGAGGKSTVEANPVQANGFGAPGVWMPDGSVTMTFTASDAANANINTTLAPSVMYFVIENLAIGGRVLLGFNGGSFGDSVSFGLGPSAGYNIGINDFISLMPTVTVSVNQVMRFGNANDTTMIGSSLLFPVLLHMAKHFFFSVGLNTSFNIAIFGPATVFTGNIGVVGGVGGWL